MPGQAAASCFFSSPSPTSPSFFFFSFHVDFRDWGGNDRNEWPGWWDNGPVLGADMGVAPALTQAGPQLHSNSKLSFSLSGSLASCALHDRIRHLSLPPQAELGVWMTREAGRLCKTANPTFGFQPQPKT